MTRLHVIVEGQTEEAFVRDVLVPHLSPLGVFPTVTIMGNRRRGRIHRGGMTSYGRLRGILDRRIKDDSSAHCTTMIDVYGLPGDFPGLGTVLQADPYGKVEHLEESMAKDMERHHRFIPYVQLHEFEALVLVDPARLRDFFPEADHPIRRLVELTESVRSPEEIDDGAETAPSKRLIQAIPAYGDAKATLGPEIARRIGLGRLRERCPHFDRWVTQLEALATPNS